VAAYGITPFPKLWASRLSSLLHPNTPNKIVDLASGSGGPLGIVLREREPLGYPLDVTLTDLYPNGREHHFPARANPEIVEGLWMFGGKSRWSEHTQMIRAKSSYPPTKRGILGWRS